MRAGLILGGIIVTAVVAYFAVAEANGARVLAPAPLVTIVPALGLQQCLAFLSVTLHEVTLVAVVGLLVGVALLGHLLRGGKRIPKPSLWCFGFVSLATLLYFVWGFRYGAEYQGASYTLAVAAMNLGLGFASAIAFRVNLMRPSFSSNFAFHFLFALWICWFAFPWLGEMP